VVKSWWPSGQGEIPDRWYAGKERTDSGKNRDRRQEDVSIFVEL